MKIKFTKATEKILYGEKDDHRDNPIRTFKVGETLNGEISWDGKDFVDFVTEDGHRIFHLPKDCFSS
jgi:hypothetical protein